MKCAWESKPHVLKEKAAGRRGSVAQCNAEKADSENDASMGSSTLADLGGLSADNNSIF